MRMMSISLIVVSSWLSLFAQPDGVQLDIQKHFGVPQPKRLFSIDQRIGYNPEEGLILSNLFLINQDGYYFYISFLVYILIIAYFVMIAMGDWCQILKFFLRKRDSAMIVKRQSNV